VLGLSDATDWETGIAAVAGAGTWVIPLRGRGRGYDRRPDSDESLG